MKLFARPGADWALAMTLLVGLAVSNPTAASQCGAFVQVPSPGPGTADGTLSHLAALSDGTAWAVGSESGETVFLYFDGASWSAMSLPQEVQGIAFADSTSTGDGDVWFAGTRTYDVYNVEVIFLRMRDGDIDRIDSILSPRAPIDVSASSSVDVWALTGAGDVIHFDGSAWAETKVPPPFQRLYPRGVYAAGPGDVWAVGYGGNGRGEYIGYAQHWDGASWTTVPTPFDGLRNHFFRGVDGSGSDDVWIVGYVNYSQTISLGWDGGGWTQVSGPTSDAPFLDVSALATGDAWATAYSQDDAHMLYHWDGNGWSGVVPLAPPGGASVRWSGLAEVGICDLWTTGSYTAETGSQSLVARLQPGGQATVFVEGVAVERPSADADYATARVTLGTLDGRTASEVEVFGTFTGPGPTTLSLSETSNEQGVAVATSPSVAQSGIWCFDVTQLDRAGWLYDPSLNVMSGDCEDVIVDPAIFVSDIAVTIVRLNRRFFQGQAVVTLTDTDLAPVAGATVTGTFSGTTSETLSIVTDAEGRATFSSQPVRRRDASGGWCFRVNDVAWDGYDPALNLESSGCTGN